MKHTLLTGGRLIDKASGYNEDTRDILLVNGKIAEIAAQIAPQAGWEVMDLAGKYVSAGFIDTHTHVYSGASLSIKADRVGLRTGVTTLFDAGSAGPQTMDDFIATDILPAQTRILSAMHFVKTGLTHMPEADSPEKYDVQEAIAAAKKYSNYVVAIKARASNSTVGKLGIIPIKAAKEVALAADLPLMVHIGNPPPQIEEVLEVMQAGDVITHAYHGKINGLLQDGKIKEATQQARDRGVLFDVGHGVASFNFKTAAAAFAQGFFPDIVSTDLHAHNVDGPVYNLPVTMSKMLALGISLGDCISMVTSNPAKAYRLDARRLGALQIGWEADLTVFEVEEKTVEYKDSDANSLTGHKSIRVHSAFLAGCQVLAESNEV